MLPHIPLPDSEQKGVVKEAEVKSKKVTIQSPARLSTEDATEAQETQVGVSVDIETKEEKTQDIQVPQWPSSESGKTRRGGCR